MTRKHDQPKKKQNAVKKIPKIKPGYVLLSVMWRNAFRFNSKVKDSGK